MHGLVPELRVNALRPLSIPASLPYDVLPQSLFTTRVSKALTAFTLNPWNWEGADQPVSGRVVLVRRASGRPLGALTPFTPAPGTDRTGAPANYGSRVEAQASAAADVNIGGWA